MVKVDFISPVGDINPENDNVDVVARMDDGRVYNFLVATPNNIYWCMENEAIDYYFGVPPLFVKRLTRDNVERAIRAIVEKDDGCWLGVYGALQQTEDQSDLL